MGVSNLGKKYALECRILLTPQISTNCTSCIFVRLSSATPEWVVDVRQGHNHEPFEVDPSVVLERSERIQKSVIPYIEEWRKIGIKTEKRNSWR